jgi:hypothetical protein
MSHHRNPRVAAQEAAERALEAAGVERPDFVFTFATQGYDQQALLQGVRETTADAPLCGCSGEGVIAPGEADESNFAVAVMAIRSDQIKFCHGIATGLGQDPYEVGREIAQAVRQSPTPDALALFLFPDGLTVNYQRLVTGLEEKLDTDHLLPLLGGTAGNSMSSVELTYQYHDDRVVSDGVAWALLSGQAQVVWAVSHGCVPIGIEYTVTRSEGNVIHEVDGRPFLDVLKDYLSSEDLENWATAANAFPIGIKAPGYMGGYDGYLIRTLMTKDDITGSVTIPTEVSEGTSIRLMRRDYEKLAAGVERVAEQVQTQLGDKPAKLVFQFDCAGRGQMFLREQQKLQLLGVLQGRIRGPDVPWLGFHTFGEISPVGRHNCFHNLTVVLTAIFE